jgi:hypothetical protein
VKNELAGIFSLLMVSLWNSRYGLSSWKKMIMTEESKAISEALIAIMKALEFIANNTVKKRT